MGSRWQNRHGGKRSRVITIAAVIAGLFALLVVGRGLHANAAPTLSPANAPNRKGSLQTDANTMPVFKLVEGAKGSPNPYTPRVLHIPAGHKVLVAITDHLGGCALVTVFPGLGADGGTARVRVPVGQTRRVMIRAAKPGRYRYHCFGEMYYGEIVAR